MVQCGTRILRVATHLLRLSDGPHEDACHHLVGILRDSASGAHPMHIDREVELAEWGGEVMHRRELGLDAGIISVLIKPIHR